MKFSNGQIGFVQKYLSFCLTSSTECLTQSPQHCALAEIFPSVPLSRVDTQHMFIYLNSQGYINMIHIASMCKSVFVSVKQLFGGFHGFETLGQSPRSSEYVENVVQLLLHAVFKIECDIMFVCSRFPCSLDTLLTFATSKVIYSLHQSSCKPQQKVYALSSISAKYVYMTI